MVSGPDNEGSADKIEEEITHSTEFCDGDVELLSSDSVLFRLQRFQLQTWSYVHPPSSLASRQTCQCWRHADRRRPVFRDMLSDAAVKGESRITFHDDQIESEAVLDVLCGMLLRQEDITDFQKERDDAYVAFIQLADKYDIELLTQMAKAQLYAYVHNRATNRSVDLHDLRMSLALEDKELGWTIITIGMYNMAECQSIEMDGGLPNVKCALDFRSTSWPDYCKIPASIMWTLLRFSQQFPHFTRSEDEMEESWLWERFNTLLAESGEYRKVVGLRSELILCVTGARWSLNT